MLTVNGKFKGHKFVTSPMRIHENMQSKYKKYFTSLHIELV